MYEKAFFGRYWPGDSIVHRLDPRTKLLLSVAFMIIVFAAQDWLALGLCAAFTLLLYLISAIPPAQAIRSILPLLFIVIITALLNVLFVQGGQVYFQWGVLCISEAGLIHAAFISVRLVLLLLGVSLVRVSEGGVASAAFLSCRLGLLVLVASLLTLTTTNLDITEAFERLLTPLTKVRFPAHELAMMMGIALRFLPQFAFELRTVYRAQVSRGARFTINPFRGGATSLSSLMVPLFASAFRHAETLSAAMEARCYHGSVGRTRLHPLAFAGRDGGAAAAMALMLIAVILANLW